jgi:hypothetical protein
MRRNLVSALTCRAKCPAMSTLHGRYKLLDTYLPLTRGYKARNPACSGTMLSCVSSVIVTGESRRSSRWGRSCMF